MTDAPHPGLEVDAFDPDTRPQDDLFRHVNGRWIDATEIPDDKARWGSFHFLAEQAEAHVREIVEESRRAEPGTQARKIGDLYTSFMDTDRIEALGAVPIASSLAAVDAVDSIPAFLALVGRLERDGVGGLFDGAIEPDPGDPERYVPFLGQGALSLPDESYYRLEGFASTRQALREHIERMLRLASIEDEAAAAQSILELETEIASHHWDNVRSRDVVAIYNLKTWDELVALTGLDLQPWREAIAPGRPEAFDEVVVCQPDFFSAVGAMLTEQRLPEWKSWLRFQVVHSAAPYLSEAFVDESFAFYGTELTGVPVNRERWKRAVSVVESAMGEAVGRIYVERHFPPAAKAAMDELVANLIEAYRQSISGLDWMSPATREKALAKLDAFTPKIGYPAVWRDYTDLQIEATDLIGNVRRARRFEHDRQVAKVGGPIDRDEWFMTPQTVNAYYNPMMNEIVFPAAILQYPFFDADRDAAANYGGIGAVIGHEIGHGFDDQGSRFDGSGRLSQWWTDEDLAAFEQRTKSLIDQYDGLVPAGVDGDHHVNGALTIGENIGDLGGLGIAIKAYALADADPAVIDGYTGIQRLLLSWGQVWRQKGRDAETIRLLTIDPHSPNEFRCNQILRNVDAFYDAFGVTESDGLWLAPQERVTIW